MNSIKKVWKIVAAVLLLLPLFAGSLSASAVTEVETANVTVHKRVFKDELPELKLNTGLEMPDFGGDPLAGAGFTVYDVTDKYHAALTGSDQTAAMNAVIADYTGGGTGFTVVATEQLTTAPDGTTVFTNLPLISSGKDAAYLFVETTAPATPTIIQTALPFILAMPIYTAMDADGELNTDIHVYPKNVTAENKKEMTNEDSFDLVEIGGTEYRNVQIGDILSYKLTVQIPANIGTRTSFVIKDTPGAGMEVADPSAITVEDEGGLALPAAAYTVTPATPTSDITVTLTMGDAAVRALASKTLIITYDMVLTEDAVPDTVIENNASVRVNNGTEVAITPPPGVFTGGKQFIKKDKHTAKGLAGAEFKVKKGDQWAKFTSNALGEYAFDGWGTEADATVVTAGADGTFKVTGLTVGNYELKETAAPDGYVLLADNVEFTVAAGGYGSTEQLRLTVNNVPKGLLPSTGGSGIYAFLIIGSMMMAGAYFWFKRSKEHAEV